MIRLRTATLLLTAIALLLIWYLVGGKEQIQWHLDVRRAAQGGWDISQANRWGWDRSHRFLPILLFASAILMIAGAIEYFRPTRKGDR